MVEISTITYKAKFSICSVLAAFSFCSFTICRLGKQRLSALQR